MQTLDEAAARLARWQATGDDRRDPVRFRFLEALARRGALHGGAARRRIEAQLAEGLAAFEGRLAQLAALDSVVEKPAGQEGPLAGLLRELESACAPSEPSHGQAATGPRGVPPLRTVASFRSTWTRLSLERRLAQVLSKVPDNAGPLHSQQLVHRALRLMQESAPGYLHHFLMQVDTLMGLEQAQMGPARDTTTEASASSPSVSGERRPKAGRGR